MALTWPKFPFRILRRHTMTPEEQPQTPPEAPEASEGAEGAEEPQVDEHEKSADYMMMVLAEYQERNDRRVANI